MWGLGLWDEGLGLGFWGSGFSQQVTARWIIQRKEGKYVSFCED